MYLARFDGGHHTWVQAVAMVQAGHVHAPAAAAAAELTSRQLCVAAQIPRATVARRLSIAEDGRLTEVLAIAVPAANETDLRTVVARLSRVEFLAGVRLCLASSAAERDAWMDAPHRLRLAASATGFRIGTTPLACPFRLDGLRDRLFEDAARLSHALSYQVHVRAADPTADDVRSIRKAAHALRGMPGVRGVLADLQENLARGLADASVYCEEYLAVDRSDVASLIEHEIDDAFRARYRALGFPPLDPRFEADGHADAMATGLHLHDLEPLELGALCGLIEAADGRDALLSWTPASSPTHGAGVWAPRNCPATLAAPTLPDDDAPTPDVVDPAVFVSYKRTDAPRVWPIIRALQHDGIGVWYDRGIPGGAEWDAVLEERLQRARVVLLCASPAAIGSKHVRREVKFADACDIPIMPVLLEDTELSHGLRILLASTQMLDVRRPDFDAGLLEAVRRLLRRTAPS